MNFVSQTPVTIVNQGVPLVSTVACVSHKYDDIALIELDLTTKWCEVSGTCASLVESTSIFISPTERGLGRTVTVSDTDTELRFPDFVGWDIAIVECSRYTLTACMIKRSSFTVS